jgi:protein-S-isoprenylcysteine O-methyltransferase Ste14
MKSRLLFSSIIISLIFSVILFIAAGSTNYFQGWLYLSTTIITSVLTYVYTRNNEELIKERSRIGEGTKSWDKKILAVSSLLYLVFLVVAGLDTGRFGWTPETHRSIYFVGAALIIGGQIIFLIAKKENRFFSAVVRIQSERGHTVCDTGIYKLVRHPGYLGMLISHIGLPLITGSRWGIIPVGITIALLMLRTGLEDATLKKELDGYLEYTLKTKKKIIPGVW